MKVNQLLLEVEQILNATDPTELAQAATATAKLHEIDKQLEKLRREPRVDRARAYVKEQIKKVRIASIESV
jgi:MoxR-like ATPase